VAFLPHQGAIAKSVRRTDVDARGVGTPSERREQPAWSKASVVGWHTVMFPAGFGVAALGLLVYDHFARLDTPALLVAWAILVAVITRLALTFAACIDLIASSRLDAVSDPLTGLANRRALAIDLERALTGKAGERYVLALFDLDGFKRYNDTFGHPAGDALLERCAGALATAEHGGAAYRMGGDEFCLLAPLADGADQLAAERIAELGARALTTWGGLFEIRSSHGAAIVPDEAATPADALSLADRRMYMRKAAGRRSRTGAAIDALLRTTHERSGSLGEPGADVADLAGHLAAAIQLPALEREHVRLAATVHDVGKFAIPDSILHKPGPLEAGEREFMQRHSAIGERILGEAPALALIGGLVRASHERWNGSGYPDGLTGTEIPLGSRIISLCDAYHAMVSDRTYRAATSHAEAIADLRRSAGTQFDPALIEPFVLVVEHRLALSAPAFRFAA
jgi:two-component system cell cycle response regulator